MATAQKETWFGKAAVVTASDSNHPACPSGLLALPAVSTRHCQEMWIVNLAVQLVEESITPLSLCLLVLMELCKTTQQSLQPQCSPHPGRIIYSHNRPEKCARRGVVVYPICILVLSSNQPTDWTLTKVFTSP